MVLNEKIVFQGNVVAQGNCEYTGYLLGILKVDEAPHSRQTVVVDSVNYDT